MSNALSANSGVRRVTVNLRAKDYERLCDLADHTGLSKNDVIRKALATEAWVQRMHNEGRKVLVADGKDIREVVWA